jgi:dienelactone hydrolase
VALAVFAAVAVAGLAACSSSDDANDNGADAAADTSADTPADTSGGADAAFAFAEPGPFPVGVTTLTGEGGLVVEVWYPAAEGTSGTDTYDVRDFTPEAVQALLTGDAEATFTIDAGRDADSAPGSFPVVLFSHGSSGFRLQSSFLTSHLASWGMVVAAPDHPSRDLTNVLSGTASRDRSESVDELLATILLLEDEAADDSGLLAGSADTTRVGALGHSAGGGTILGAAADPAVDGYVSMASGILTAEGEEPPALPAKPSFFLAGALDEIVPPERTEAAFADAPEPSLLWVLEGVGHNGFDDFCTFGGGTGIIGVADASGLGELLDAQPQLRRLGEDGCLPPAVPVEEIFPVINHAVTSWFRALFGEEQELVGLGPEVADAYPVPVAIEVRD